MSYYFTILNPHDKPVFDLTFGTWKSGGDGIARFHSPSPSRTGDTNTSRYMNQFIVHASLDIVEEVQWINSAMYLKHIDTYPPTSSHISCFLTPSNMRFLLLHQPPAPSSSSGPTPSSAAAGSRTSTTSTSGVPHNPTSPQTEEAIRQFMLEVYELWTKTVMNPFYDRTKQIRSPVFRLRVVASGRKWL